MLQTYGDLHIVEGARGLQVKLTGLRLFDGETYTEPQVQVSIGAPDEYPGIYVYVNVDDVARAMEW